MAAGEVFAVNRHGGEFADQVLGNRQGFPKLLLRLGTLPQVIQQSPKVDVG